LVKGKNLVPNPAAGITALLTSDFTIESPLSLPYHIIKIWSGLPAYPLGVSAR
jgi:hypothetical protein